ncbi:inositol-pentakisphosphate 2-kinase protein [Rutstroemia sp. NJR-2017a BVV2]|nr:inositol-pentakisphosphate 2-kinase protein [Rutstroemia sp. NJR-2017a BVV2]
MDITAMNMNSPENNNPATVTYNLPDALTLTYVGEGAANVVYRIGVHPQPRPIIPPELEGTPAAERALSNWKHHVDAATYLSNKLLRLRKDLPTTAPTEVSHHNWLRLFYPLFKPEELVEQQLVTLNSKSLIKALNRNLLHNKLSYSTVTANPSPERDFLRGQSRSGTYLAEDEYGLLITDMTPKFKPKWLTQSPNAPPHSRRCRTCALNARKRAGKKQGANLGPDFCPLRLVLDHKDPRVRELNYRAFWTQLMDRELLEESMKRLCKWVEGRGVFAYLGGLQGERDGVGVLGLGEREGGEDDAGEGEDFKKMKENLQVAMTLRDCSFYMRFDADDNLLETRIGDLDFKSADKVGEWRRKERELRDEGWYLGLERVGAGEGVGGDGGRNGEGEERGGCLLSPWTGMRVRGGWGGKRNVEGDGKEDYTYITPMGELFKNRRPRRRSWGGSTEVEFRREVRRVVRGSGGGMMGEGRWERRNSFDGGEGGVL